MRIGQYRTTDEQTPWPGVATDDGVVDLAEAGAAAGIHVPDRTSDLLADWEWRRKVDLAVEHAAETGVGVRDSADLDRAAPVDDPQKVVCVGLNYRDHAEEGDNEIPDEPVLFSKFPTSVVGPDDAVRWDPDYTEKVDYEAELVAVIGERARRVEPDEAMDHVAGFTVGNDVSARDLQHGDGQWVRGKSLDTFAPTGPELVTTDEVGDPHDLEIFAEINGERLQESSTENLIFGVDELISFCSQAFTLEPGDLIFTGTPPGVGVYRDPPVLLGDGDSVTIGVEGVGELTNQFETE
ncbi:5-carboxymethyl-2-hydroxymuconate delta-isomerase [Halorubrum distributum JCM 9100]|uniref:5-carboxymethyl-2-hydroxymuconate delta-isomerase n=2 Tax=Halorubrum distributum TaxID=29283 RepID=M0EB12_9EURY|nr:fumarylacetoacetate hydrolase family protein [Halorubrum distributum]ELZ44955.1 5-carboxymethyl-2-hydroxymuconate delta-isomerase [Halorubrum distributum JCM 9100]ELZ51061.1 5-carboxymethyl-2-hydroxymuconate delta-isomerase [Halorubrum distributum JCM 10118]